MRIKYYTLKATSIFVSDLLIESYTRLYYIELEIMHNLLACLDLCPSSFIGICIRKNMAYLFKTIINDCTVAKRHIIITLLFIGYKRV